MPAGTHRPICGLPAGPLIPHQDTGTGEPGAVKINAVDAAGRERPRLTVIRKSAIERIQPHRDHGLRRSVIFREQRTVAAGDQKRLHPGKRFRRRNRGGILQFPQFDLNVRQRLRQRVGHRAGRKPRERAGIRRYHRNFTRPEHRPETILR